MVEAGLLRIQDWERCCVVRSLHGKHIGRAGDVHVDGGPGRVDGNAATSHNCGSPIISATEVGGVEHALGTAVGRVDLAGKELGSPGGGVGLGLVAVGVGREAVAGRVSGSGDAGDVGVASGFGRFHRATRSVDGHSGDRIGAIAGEIGGIGESVSVVDGVQGEGAEESVGTGKVPGYGVCRLEGIAGGRKVGRSGRTGNVNIRAGIDCDSCQAVSLRSTEIGCVNQLLRVLRRRTRIDHRDEDVLRARKRTLVRWGGRGAGRQWKVRRGGRACDINPIGGTDRDLHQTLAAASEVGGIGQDRVDDEFAAVVIVADGEADSVAGELAKTSRDRLALVSVLLIDDGSVETHVSVGGREDQIS